MEYDVIIIGGGGAGLMAALEASRSGARTALFSKTAPNRSQSVMAQGGINAALGNVEPDSVDDHIADTIKGGAGLSDPECAALLCGKALEIIDLLDRLGTPFNRTAEGKVDQRPFGGASRKRTCFSSDMTGHAIVHTLYDQLLQKENIHLFSEYVLLDLLQEGGSVCGARFLVLATGEIVSVRSKSVVLATGGYAGIFFNHTTNTPQSTGDGLAAAMEAGAALKNMEFVQFHPTTLKNSSLLISEAARGAGAYLINDRGERFVDELTTRDKVTKAIQAQIDSGSGVYLDLRHLDPDLLEGDLHHEVAQCRIYEGVDPSSEPVPIKPSAHYTMGGIAIDLQARVQGESGAIPGLYACGECAHISAHGANRLGGNSLLDILVFGRIAGAQAADFAASRPAVAETLREPFSFPDQGRSFYPLRTRFEQLMNTKASVVKNAPLLESALDELSIIEAEFQGCAPQDKVSGFNTERVEFLEFKNMLLLARIYLSASLRREESRGSHLRSDFPDKSQKWEISSRIFKKHGNLIFQDD